MLFELDFILTYVMNLNERGYEHGYCASFSRIGSAAVLPRRWAMKSLGLWATATTRGSEEKEEPQSQWTTQPKERYKRQEVPI